MKSKSYIFILLALTSIGLMSQEGKSNFNYFFSSTDFVNKIAGEEDVVPIIKDYEKDYLRIFKIVDSDTGRRNKMASISWAVEYDSIYYFNLRYSIDLQNTDLYVKADIVGEFCALIIDGETSLRIKNGGPNYGGGLTGVLLKNSAKWGGNWISEEGEKMNILIADTKKLEIKHRFCSNTEWKYLTRKNLNEILDVSMTKDEIKELKLEDVMDLIKKNSSG